MEDGRDLVQLFVSIGLSEIKAKETLKNANVSGHLKNCIDSVMPVNTFNSTVKQMVCVIIKDLFF